MWIPKGGALILGPVLIRGKKVSDAASKQQRYRYFKVYCETAPYFLKIYLYMVSYIIEFLLTHIIRKHA